MENIDINKFFEIANLNDIGNPCHSHEDCAIAEEINHKMKNVCQTYSSMVERSYQLCAGLRLARFKST